MARHRPQAAEAVCVAFCGEAKQSFPVGKGIGNRRARPQRSFRQKETPTSKSVRI